MSEQQWKLVPVEPTEEMMWAAMAAMLARGGNIYQALKNGVAAASKPPVLAESVKTLGYMWKTWQNDAPMVGPALMLNGSKPSFVIELVDRAHTARLQAEVSDLTEENRLLAKANADCGEQLIADRDEKSRLQAEVERLRSALKFYAEREHYHFESGNWDTVCGEPLNILWNGEEPDFIEDGTVARNALAEGAKS